MSAGLGPGRPVQCQRYRGRTAQLGQHPLWAAVSRVPTAFGTQLPACPGLSGRGQAGTPGATFLSVLLTQEEGQRPGSFPGS